MTALIRPQCKTENHRFLFLFTDVCEVGECSQNIIFSKSRTIPGNQIEVF